MAYHFGLLGSLFESLAAQHESKLKNRAKKTNRGATLYIIIGYTPERIYAGTAMLPNVSAGNQ